MRGNVVIQQRWCPGCKHAVAAQRNSGVWGCGDLILILLTVGLWLPIRMTLAGMSSPWRCPQCGSRV